MRPRTTGLIFLVSAVFLGLFFATPGFGDPDAAYHLWMAKRTLATGPVTAFPWLPLTSLASRFADQQFLYHLLLIPFITAFGDFLGLKIATVSFAALAVTVFSVMIGTYGVRRPWLWAAPMLFAPGFVFRLLLTKAGALAMTTLFLALIALKRRNRPALFAIAFAYVWLHAGWPLLAVVVFVHDAILCLKERRASAFALTGVTLAGLGLGLVVNPFFPANVAFDLEQIVRMAVLRGDPGVVTGVEWYPLAPARLVRDDAVAFVPLLAVLGALVSAMIVDAPRSDAAVTETRRHDLLFASALAGVLLALTLKQARQLEYFIPMLLFASALWGQTLFEAIDARALAARLGRWRVPAAAFGLLLAASLAAVSSVHALRTQWGRDPFTRFAAVGAWMRANVPPGELVFHERWDDFPYLLYRDDANAYVAGLDPRFLSDHDRAKYWEWRDIVEGRRRNGLASLITKDFGAHYVLLRNFADALRPLMKKDAAFERVYVDGDAEVWRIR